MSEFYSRIASASLKKETSVNVAVIPNTFFHLNDETLEAKYAYTPSMPVSNNRAINLRAIKAAIPAIEGSINVNVEPKSFGHFLNGIFGGVTSGRVIFFTPGSGTFQLAETVTSTGSSGTVVFVGDGYLLLSGPSGSFTAGDTLTGGTSAATGTITKYNSSVYGHAGILPDSSMPTYTVQFNFADMAVRYIGVRFTALDALAQNENIITAGIKVMAQGQFRHARVKEATTSGAGTKTITVDQTYGLVAADSVKVYRPSTGAFLDFSATSVKTHTIDSIASTTTFTVTNLETAVAADDLIILAPQTATYSIANEFPWIGGSYGEIGETTASLATADIEDFTMIVTNEYEARHAAKGDLFANRFPTAILQKGLQGSGTMKAYYQDEDFIRASRRNTARAMRIRTAADLIGATALNYELWMTFPEVQFDPYQTNIEQDAIVDEEIPFTAFYNTTKGALAICLLVNEVTSY